MTDLAKKIVSCNLSKALGNRAYTCIIDFQYPVGKGYKRIFARIFGMQLQFAYISAVGNPLTRQLLVQQVQHSSPRKGHD